MVGLELVPLDSGEADAYWKAFVAGRNDQPTDNFVLHMERYLRLPPEEQAQYFAFKENGAMVGTVRIAGDALTGASNALTFFSLVPDARGWARDAVLLAAEPMIANGAAAVHASYDDSYADVFAKLGFRERFARMRMEAPLTKREKPDVPMAHPEATDVEDIAAFFMGVYEGHLEQQFGMHVGSPSEWRDYVTSIWKGESGKYLPLASWLAREEAGIAGASLASEWMGAPLLSEIGVRRDRRRRGLARAVLTATENALADLGYERLALYVTLGNDPAIRMYDAMGFHQAGGRTVSGILEL